MKRRFSARLLAAVLCLSLLLGACTSEKKETQSGVSSASSAVSSGSAEAGPVLKDEETVTVGEAADYLLAAAAKYNRKLPEKSGLMENGEGLGEQDSLTRLLGLVMIGRAFGTLPGPVGNNARIAPQKADLSTVPDWAKEALENLNLGGVLDGSDLGLPAGDGGEAEASAAGAELAGPETGTAENAPETEAGGEAGAEDTAEGEVSPNEGDSGESEAPKSPEDPLTGKELKVLTARVYALFGTELKDDFYTAVNKNALDKKEIPAGETDAGGTYDQRIMVQNQINAIIKEIVEGDGYEPGSAEQKIKDYYESAVNFTERNRLGAEPLRKYLDAIDRAANLQELTEAQVLALKETGTGGLLGIAYVNDIRDTTKKTASLFPPFEPVESVDEASNELNIRLLTLSGESEEEAKAHVEAYNALNEALKPYAPTPEDYADPAKVTGYADFAELQELLPGLDVKAIIEAAGDEIPAEFTLQAPKLFEGFGKLMQEEQYLPAIKTALKLQIITVFYSDLSQDFLDAFDEYNQKTLGQAPSNSTPEEIAYALVSENLGDYIDRLYAQRHFSPEAKQDVENMVKQFIQVYKERVQSLPWMGEETKKAAVEKLDSMKFFIGYPNQWNDSLEGLEITESFFQNQAAIQKITMRTMREEAAAKNRGELENDMKIPVATVNAYYDQFTNTMCFPAGILQAPAYDVNASLEENLGGIGATIAHEISHAFDNQGAKYDKNGLQNDWWKQEDYAKFQELCDQAEAFYDGWESAPGVAINGKQTLGENIADIGGVACALEVLKKTENPDYDKFFRAYAEGWLKCTTRARSESMAELDEHSPSNLRVNRVLSNFQEFYDTYGIREGDGMFVPTGNRIQIW